MNRETRRRRARVVVAPRKHSQLYLDLMESLHNIRETQAGRSTPTRIHYWRDGKHIIAGPFADYAEYLEAQADADRAREGR